MSKFIKIIIVVILATGAVFYARANDWFAPKPCSKPIPYSLGSFDNKFNISQTQFLADVNKAAQIWDDAAGKNLFQYSTTGDLKINLVYDYRQQATDKLKSLGYTIDDSESSYNSLKTRYDSQKSQYEALKAKVEADSATYNKNRQAYEEQVNYWNSRGGASKETVQQLNAERDALNAQAAAIQQEQNQLNSLVDSLNGLADVLNRLGSELNKDVSSYNTIGQSRGSEFEEGLYRQDSSGREIDIYEFTDQNQLVRVLAHELGHALGLQH